jgi:hypothetical protein
VSLRISRTTTSCRDKKTGQPEGGRKFPEEILRIFTRRQSAGILIYSSSSFSPWRTRCKEAEVAGQTRLASILCSEIGGISERGQGVKIPWQLVPV